MIEKLPEELFFHIFSHIIGEKTLYFYDCPNINEYLNHIEYNKELKIIDETYLKIQKENNKIKENIFSFLKINKKIRKILFNYINNFKIFHTLSFIPKFKKYNIDNYEIDPIFDHFNEKKILNFLEFYYNLEDSIFCLKITDRILKRIKYYEIEMPNIKFLHVEKYDDLYFQNLNPMLLLNHYEFNLEYNKKIEDLNNYDSDDSDYIEEEEEYVPEHDKNLNAYLSYIQYYNKDDSYLLKHQSAFKKKLVEDEIEENYISFLNELIINKMNEKPLKNKYNNFFLKGEKYYELDSLYYYNILKKDFYKRKNKNLFLNLKLLYVIEHLQDTLNPEKDIFNIIKFTDKLIYHFFLPVKHKFLIDETLCENMFDIYLFSENFLKKVSSDVENYFDDVEYKILKRQRISFFKDIDETIKEADSIFRMFILSDKLFSYYDKIKNYNKFKKDLKQYEKYEKIKYDYPIYFSFNYKYLNDKYYLPFNIYDIENDKDNKNYDVNKYKNDFKVLYNLMKKKYINL